MYMGLGFGGVAIAAIAKVVLGHIVTRRLTNLPRGHAWVPAFE